MKLQFEGDTDLVEEVMKALTAGTGGPLVDDVRDSVIGEELDKRHQTWANLRRQPGVGSQALVTRKTARPTAGWVGETAQQAPSDATYTSASFDYKVISAVGGVSRKLRLGAVNVFGDFKDQAVMDELDAVVNLIESTLQTGTGAGDIPTGIDTFIDAGAATQRIEAGVAPAGDFINLRDLDKAIDAAEDNDARIRFAITSSSVRREWNALLQSQQRFVQETEIKGGFTVMTYQGIPVLRSNGVVADGDGLFRISWLDDETGFWIQHLLLPTVFELALTKASQEDFEVLGIMAFVLKNRIRVSQNTNIKLTP
jgi:hypothetical protein